MSLSGTEYVWVGAVQRPTEEFDVWVERRPREDSPAWVEAAEYPMEELGIWVDASLNSNGFCSSLVRADSTSGMFMM